MSGSAPEAPQTSVPPSTASVPGPAPVAVGPGGASDVSLEFTLCKEVTNRSLCQISSLDTNQDRQPPGEIWNVCHDCQSTASAQGPWQPAQPNSSVQVHSGTQDGVTQQRERCNRMERDQRCKIQICCDELNLLVPFCTVDTDVATTLQWTTAFLKYIQERHGDSLKQEFETVFLIKQAKEMERSDSFVTCPMQENMHGWGCQVM